MIAQLEAAFDEVLRAFPEGGVSGVSGSVSVSARSADHDGRPEPTVDDLRVVPLPNGETSRRHVDLAGRRRLDELPDGTWLRYRYDAEGNPSAVEHSGGERVDYDVGGRSWSDDRARAATDHHPRSTTTGLPAAVEQCVGRDRAARRVPAAAATAASTAVRYPGRPAGWRSCPTGRAPSRCVSAG